MKENMDMNELEEQTNPGVMGGVFLLLIGGIFLLQNMGIRILGQNSWVLFMLIPVFWILVSAWRQYVANGRRITRSIFYMFGFGLMPFAFVAANTVLGISWGTLWPFGLILAGLGIILFRPPLS